MSILNDQYLYFKTTAIFINGENVLTTAQALDFHPVYLPIATDGR